MAHLTLAGLSDDGKRLLLVDDQGAEHTLPVDGALRRALQGEHARLGQLEIDMDASLRPRDIQARIRAGETPEAVAQAASTTVDRIMAYASPVLAERAHIADRAQRARIRRAGGEGGSSRVLDDAVTAHLVPLNVASDTVEWDAWRREDGKWTLTGAFDTSARTGSASFTFDAPGNYVTVENDDARWLIGEELEKPAAKAKSAGTKQQRRRLTAVPLEQELPLGEDALEMVHEETADDSEATPEPTPDSAQDSPQDSALAEDSPFLAKAFDRQNVADQDKQADQDEQAEQDEQSEQPAETDQQAPVDGASAVDDTSVHDDEKPEEAPAPKRPAKKRGGRASVPSWDEIMFGGKD